MRAPAERVANVVRHACILRCVAEQSALYRGDRKAGKVRELGREPQRRPKRMSAVRSHQCQPTRRPFAAERHYHLTSVVLLMSAGSLQFRGLRSLARFDIAQALPIRRPRKDHARILIETGETLDPVLAGVMPHAATKRAQWKMAPQLRKHELALMREPGARTAGTLLEGLRGLNRVQVKTHLLASFNSLDVSSRSLLGAPAARRAQRRVGVHASHRPALRPCIDRPIVLPTILAREWVRGASAP